MFKNRNYEYEIVGDTIKIHYKLTENIINKSLKCIKSRNIDTKIKDGKLEILIDKEDFCKIKNYTLTVSGRHLEESNTHKNECWQLLLVRRIGCGKRSVNHMHRLIMGVDDKNIQVDHINQNQLDNRKINLRLVSNLHNQHNVTRARICNKSGYRNVHKKEVGNNIYWFAKVKRNGEAIIRKCFPYTDNGLLEASKAVEMAIEKFNIENPIIEINIDS